MLLSTALALLVAAAPPQDTTRGVIRGVVHSEASGHPVPLAAVEADDGRTLVVALADGDGAYRLRVGAGWQRLRVRHLDHAPLELDVLVPPDGEVEMHVSLTHRPVRLQPVRVGAEADPRADSAVAARTELGLVVDHHAIDDPGLGGALGRGVVDGGGEGEVLYVRGSAAALQLVLLDGAPVYAPFHTGGLIESFDPQLVGSARLYLGGAPARYDGGLSYVMDLSTRAGRGDRHSVGGSFDLVSAGLRAEGPLGEVHYLAAARGVHGASLARIEGEPFPYDFADGLLRLDAPLPGGGLSLTAFANREGVRVDTVGAGDGFARWGNRAGSLRYRGRFEGADVEITAAAGRFHADFPIRDRLRLFVLQGSTDRGRVALDFVRTEGRLLLRYGAALDRTWLSHTATEGEEARSLIQARSAGTTAGGYLDGAWQPVPQVLLRAGARADVFSVDDRFVVAPRLSATWLLAEGAALTLAGGRYHQYVRIPRPVGPGEPLRNYADSVRLPTQLAVGGATHLSIGLDQLLGGGVRLGLEGFYKRFDGLPPPDSVDLVDHTSGMDVWVRRAAGGVTGWLGYSLAWAWSSELATGVGSRFTGRHTLSAGAQGTVWGRTMVGARFGYGAGLAMTPLGLADQVLQNDLPALSAGATPTEAAQLAGRGPGSFMRLDVHAARTWSPRLAGRATEVTPYLRVLNALDSRDGLFYRYFSGEGEPGLQAVGTLPVVPVFGVEWRF